jgi:methionine-gamma-lyase
MKKDTSVFTQAVHAGDDLSKHYGAVSVPIYNASLYAFEDAEEGRRIHNYEQEGYFYGRLGNPTQEALELAMAQLEHGEAALAFASGMAAISAGALSVVKAGDHIVAPEGIYANAQKLFDYLQESLGISVTYVDATDAANYAAAIRPETKLFHLESPSNPILKITDIAAAVSIAKAGNIRTLIDNTFASPFNQTPLDMGVDLVAHSATKYLGGHSDLTAGMLIGSRELIDIARHKTTVLFGGNIAPQTAWLVLRGIKTLALRMERHNANALKIAEFLSGHPRVSAVHYPGLSSHKNHDVAARQMRGFGGMVSFDVGSVEAGVALLNGLEVCLIATSLGGVETVMQHSASMTNAKTPREVRLRSGITDGMIRLSVGVEAVEDLIADLDQALGKIG